MQPFNALSTAEEVARGFDLRHLTAIITGASGGIGLETARVLAKDGAEVILAARDPVKTEAAIARIRAETPDARLDSVALDLSDLRSVRECAHEVLRRHQGLHVLINNAGVMACPLERTAQGCELQFGTNHIGHFLLTNLLMPALTHGAPSRIVIVGSAGHRFSDVDFDDPFFLRKPYDKWAAYGQAKTANGLFAAALAARLAPRGITANVVHPGRIETDLVRHMTDQDRAAMAPASTRTPGKTIPQGAATQVWAATSPELHGVSGRYLLDCRIGNPVSGDPPQGDYLPYVLDSQSAARLWDLSEAIVGQSFPV